MDFLSHFKHLRIKQESLQLSIFLIETVFDMDIKLIIHLFDLDSLWHMTLNINFCGIIVACE